MSNDTVHVPGSPYDPSNLQGREYEKFTVPVADNPIRSSHDFKVTRQTIKQLLANGTPNWLKWPEDYRAMVREQQAKDREVSEMMAESYKMTDQEILTDAKARLVNIIHGRAFIEKLRANGVKCFTIDNGMPGTVGLWAAKPGTDEALAICFMQVPYMPEWSVLRTDRHGVPMGEDYRGWRTILAQLILKEILTEDQAHNIFGKPVLNRISRIYRRTLYNFRNHKRLEA
jgi:hypothetical protein